MPNYRRIIFLDEENTRLSPLTAALFKKKMRQAGVEGLGVSSRGRVVLFPEPVNQKIGEVAKMEYHIDLSSYTAREITEADFSAQTLVLTMDNATKVKTYEQFTSAANVFTRKEWLGLGKEIRAIQVQGKITWSRYQGQKIYESAERAQRVSGLVSNVKCNYDIDR